MSGIGYFPSRFTELRIDSANFRRDPNCWAAYRPRRWPLKLRSLKTMVKQRNKCQRPVIRKSCPVWACSAARSFVLASFVALLPGLLLAQAASIQIPSTTPLSVQLLQHVPMKTGEPLEGRLLYPVYVENRIAIPAGTILRGSVIQLDSDRSRRIHSRLRGDFTPFHIPVVRFDQLVLPDGTLQAIVSDSCQRWSPDFAPVASARQEKGLFHRPADRCKRNSG